MSSFSSDSNTPFSTFDRLRPLNLVDLVKNGKLNEKLDDNLFDCLLCDVKYDVIKCQREYLAHLLEKHRLVVSDVEQIGDFKKYVNYWKERLKILKLEEVCFLINTNTGKNDKGQIETFYLLSDDLPEDRVLREKLNIFKLEKALAQQESERNDQNYFRNCLFCSDLVGNNRSHLINHMSTQHNFNVGNPDNIVYFDEFYLKLKERFDTFQCLYCHKVFHDKQTFKEHMRKKQHKCINPLNKEFDRFYIINYLEYSKVWQDIKSERDNDDFESNEPINIDDWNDPVQDYYCLFCDEVFENEEAILSHMTDSHKFDFKSQEMIDHLANNDHINEMPNKELWDEPEYLFSTFEDDTLLCLLDDNAYNEDEIKVKVIPEKYDVELKLELNNDLKNLNI